MKTGQNLKITSMESTFENCVELKSFNMTGFDTSNIFSVKKLFYNTQIQNINYVELLTI